MGCWSIAGYLPSYYWYPFIYYSWDEKQIGLCVLLKDTESQDFNPELPAPKSGTLDTTPLLSPKRFCLPSNNMPFIKWKKLIES
jgi:hypothetical protein